MNAFNFAQKLWRKTAAGPTNDPMAAINAKRVADMKAMASKVRTASGTPGMAGNGANGTHSWSGRVMPGGAVQGAKYTPPAAPATPPATPPTSRPQISQFQQNRAAGKLVPGQQYRGGQLVSGPGAKPLTADQQADVDFADNMRKGFANLNAGAGGTGRAGMSQPSSSTQSYRARVNNANTAMTKLVGPPQPNVTTTKVDTAALQRQLQQAQAQPTPPPAPAPAPAPAPTNPPAPQQPSMFQRAMGMLPGASAWTNQTNGGVGAVSAPLSATSTAFNNATGQQDPPHIITTDNGRKFNTQTKTFLDGRPGGFAQ